MSSVFSIERFEQRPLVGILRNVHADQIDPIVEACLEGGLTNLEVTMNSEGATDQIRTIVERAGNKLNVGAGTVTSPHRLEQAIAAGASFVVTPAVIPDVIGRCRELKLPVIPGAFTPTEIWQAWDAGALMVKLFPADLGGPNYVKSLRGPFPEIRLLATGGITLDSIEGFMNAGVEGFGLGGPLFRKERIESGDWGWLTQQIREYGKAFEAHRNH